MEKETSSLEHELLKANDIREYCRENDKEFIKPSLPEYLNNLLQLKNLQRTEVIKDSGLQNNYGYQIFSGLRTPSRDRLLALAVGFHLNFKEVQDLLKKNGYPPLYARIKRDMLIGYCFRDQRSVTEINICLENYGEKLLFDME